MKRCYPESVNGRQIRQIVARFGTQPFIYLGVFDIIPGPYTLKKMEENEWLKGIRRVKVEGRWYNEYRVVPQMKEWAEKYEENQRIKMLDSEGATQC